jgi:hypothetical protein
VGVVSADADVVEASVGAEGDDAGFVDGVAVDAVVGVVLAVGGGAGFGVGGVDRGGGGVVRERAVGAVVDVGGREGVELGLEGFEGAGVGGLGVEPVLEGLLEAFDLAAGGGVVGSCVLLCDVEAAEFVFEGAASAYAAGEAGGADHAVVGEGGGWGAVGGDGVAEAGEDDFGGDVVVAGDGEGVAGAVVEPGEDLGFGAGGEAVVGDVGLPGLVGHGGLEADVRGAGAFLGLGFDQAEPGEVAADGGGGDAGVVVRGEVPGDGGGARVEALGGELVAERADALDEVLGEALR